MNKLSIYLFVLVIFLGIASCSSDPAKVIVSPKAYNFEIVKYGLSVTNDFTVTNKYSEEITITMIEIIGEQASQFTVLNGGTPGTKINGNEGTHTITVEFAPEGDKAVAVMELNYNDDKGKPKVIEVKLEGECEPVPIFSTNVTGSNPQYDFGIVNLTDSKDFTLTVSNNGIADLNITDVQLTSADFKIQSGWSGTGFTINSSDSYDFIIRFEPTTTGALNSKISITHDAENVLSPYEIAFMGEGIDTVFVTDISGTPPELNFGEVFENVTTSSKTFKISNTGTGTLIISNMQLSSADFSIVSGWNGSTISISGGSSEEFTVRFLAKSTGSKTETLSIIHSAKNITSPYVVNLKGKANDNYEPETFTKGMNKLSGGTSVILGDDDYKTVPIGFTFNFYGQDYNQIYICSNGFIGFGPSTTNYTIGENSYPLPNTGASNNCIYLFKTDLNPTISGTISYKVEGSGTNKVLIIEFNEIPNALQQGSFSGQIRLYETTNIIELHYSTSMTWATIHWSNNIIGIENEAGSKGVDYDGVKTNPVSSAPSNNIRYK